MYYRRHIRAHSGRTSKEKERKTYNVKNEKKINRETKSQFLQRRMINNDNRPL